ncbi:MAG: archease, partial [Candidatus Omnitrophica bacterium]|nr:archease [Candidatus Omnitrophota bacterium]
MENFEFIEHTADIGVRVYGKSLEDLFQNCAQTLFSLLIDHKPAEKIEERIILEAETQEELLVTWLNELIS